MSHKRLIAGVAATVIAAGGIAVGFTNPLANAAPPPKPPKTLTLQTQQVSVWATADEYGLVDAEPVCPAGTTPISGAWDMDINLGDAVYVTTNQPSPYTENAWYIRASGLQPNLMVELSVICGSGG